MNSTKPDTIQAERLMGHFSALHPCTLATGASAGGLARNEATVLATGSGSDGWPDEEDCCIVADQSPRELPLPTRQIDPFEVRFSQMRANTAFRDGTTLEETIPEIKAVRLPKPGEDGAVWQLEAPFPPIEVLPYRCKLRDKQGRPRIDSETGGEMWDAEEHIFTLDNRRLVCYQKVAAALWPEKAVIGVVQLPPQSLSRMRQVRKFRTLDSGRTIFVGLRADEESRVRWSWREAVGIADEEKTSVKHAACHVKMRRHPRGEPRGESRWDVGRQRHRSYNFASAAHCEEAGKESSTLGSLQGVLMFLLLYAATRLGKELVQASVSVVLSPGAAPTGVAPEGDWLLKKADFVWGTPATGAANDTGEGELAMKSRPQEVLHGALPFHADGVGAVQQLFSSLPMDSPL